MFKHMRPYTFSFKAFRFSQNKISMRIEILASKYTSHISNNSSLKF